MTAGVYVKGSGLWASHGIEANIIYIYNNFEKNYGLCYFGAKNTVTVYK